MRHSLSFILIFSFFILQRCTIDSISDIEFDGTYAIPLINSKIKIKDILQAGTKTSIKVDQDGVLSLLYSTQLIDQTITELLPSISSIGEVPILDSIVQFPLNVSNEFVLKKAVFNGDEMRFRYSSNIPQNISVNMKVPELTKNNEVLDFDFLLEYKGELPFTSFTESIDLDGYEFTSSDNNLTFIYDARTPEGDRIILDYAAMSFNEISFSYGEGSLRRTENPLIGDLVPINVFSAWKSGILEFEDPKINFTIAQSYGFPISIYINDVEFTLLDNNKKVLSGESVAKEIEISYPEIYETGQSKVTTFSFDKSNSNINTLFNEKIKYVNYNVDAILNPTDDIEITGFVTENSNFKLDVDVELPLRQKIKDLIILDTIELEKIDVGFIEEAEFKIVTSNSYPSSMRLKLIFLDEERNPLFSFFGDEPFVINAGKTQNDGTTLQSQEVIRYETLETEDLNKLVQIRKVVVEALFDNSNSDLNFYTLFDEQYLELRMGLKFKI